MEKAKQFGKPVQVGIVIPKNVGMCRYMNANVAGIHVPEYMIDELKADKEKTKAGITGVEIAASENVNHTARVFISWHLDGNLKYRKFLDWLDFNLKTK